MSKAEAAVRASQEALRALAGRIRSLATDAGTAARLQADAGARAGEVTPAVLTFASDVEKLAESLWPDPDAGDALHADLNDRLQKLYKLVGKSAALPYEDLAETLMFRFMEAKPPYFGAFHREKSSRGSAAVDALVALLPLAVVAGTAVWEWRTGRRR
jgi:hypothetical protein